MAAENLIITNCVIYTAYYYAEWWTICWHTKYIRRVYECVNLTMFTTHNQRICFFLPTDWKRYTFYVHINVIREFTVEWEWQYCNVRNSTNVCQKAHKQSLYNVILPRPSFGNMYLSIDEFLLPFSINILFDFHSNNMKVEKNACGLDLQVMSITFFYTCFILPLATNTKLIHLLFHPHNCQSKF